MQTRLAAFASDHGLPQERFYNLLCLAFGANKGGVRRCGELFAADAVAKVFV